MADYYRIRTRDGEYKTARNSAKPLICLTLAEAGRVVRPGEDIVSIVVRKVHRCGTCKHGVMACAAAQTKDKMVCANIHGLGGGYIDRRDFCSRWEGK